MPIGDIDYYSLHNTSCIKIILLLSNPSTCTVITRKQWNRETTFYRNFGGVTKQIVLPDTYKITFFLNGSVYTAQLLCFMVIELFKVKT